MEGIARSEGLPLDKEKKSLYNLFMKLIARLSIMLLFSALWSQESSLFLRFFPTSSQVTIDGTLVRPDRWESEVRIFSLEPGSHGITISEEGYFNREFTVVVGEGESVSLEGKLEKADLPLYKLGELPTARQPKSVTFSPDGESLAVSSLGSDRGVQIYSLHPFAHVRDLRPPQAKKEGFVETAWFPEREELWVTQMTTGLFHVYNTNDWQLKGSFDTGGLWPKVILVSPDERRAYISHWESRTVTEIDVESRRVLRTFPVSGVPRGLALSGDGKSLLTTIYTANALDTIDLETGRVATKSYGGEPGSMRHIVPAPLGGLFYVTNMYNRSVYALSDRGGGVREVFRVGSKPNTAQVTPDGRYLFVSCRGPNNPESYLLQGHEYGKVYIIDCLEQEIVGWIWGADQTTGLDVSPDSRYLVFTNFKENTLELYKILPPL